ncbi:uncharacterized protein LOC142335889 [Convolutriloba macropyga]|uniref:uncharacterized protein LOC142335889 n=1 Tax=Convolutriloba macropyga TaxID=536237 RepID=UPI003F522E3E
MTKFILIVLLVVAFQNDAIASENPSPFSGSEDETEGESDSAASPDTFNTNNNAAIASPSGSDQTTSVGPQVKYVGLQFPRIHLTQPPEDLSPDELFSFDRSPFDLSPEQFPHDSEREAHQAKARLGETNICSHYAEIMQKF